jgi:hypothetical protein
MEIPAHLQKVDPNKGNKNDFICLSQYISVLGHVILAGPQLENYGQI